MRILKDKEIEIPFFCQLLVVFFLMFLMLTSTASNAEDKIVTRATLLDRIQIEDMVVRYYVDMSAGKHHNLSLYYTNDAVLDVNGTISKGREEIEKLYNSINSGDAPAVSGKMHMLLNNPIISVTGNTATAWFIWTGVVNEDIKKPPRFQEQGREYDELVKIKGRWYIKKRYITSDSGLPPMFEKNYKPRTFR